MDAETQIKINSSIYTYLLETRVLPERLRRNPEELLCRIRDLASFAWSNHPGFFADGRLENLLLSMAEDMDPEIANIEILSELDQVEGSNPEKAILLVASYLYEAGGHAKVVEKIIEEYSGFRLVLVITQQDESLPDAFEVMRRDGALEILNLSQCGSTMEKASTLRAIARFVNLAILFPHPNDPVPVLAFGTTDNPPVLFDNHTHFFFWLGPSVSDVIISHATYMCEMSRSRRFAARTFFLPIRYSRYLHQLHDPVDKESAKSSLDVPSGDLCLLSIVLGSTVFTSYGEQNFFSTAGQIVRRYPQVHLFLIGIGEEHELAQRYLPLETRRVHCLGIVPDPLVYYQAADIYLDAYPYPSMGGLVEAITYGEAAPLLFHGSHRGLLNSGNIFESDLDLNPIDSDDYFARLEELIHDSRKRRSLVAILKKEQQEVESRLQSVVRELYEENKGLSHSVRPLPHSSPDFQDDDLRVAAMTQHKGYREVMKFLKGTALMGRAFSLSALRSRVYIYGVFIRRVAFGGRGRA
ncbi:MAG: glycosyltransferase family 4 protein [Myxococcota bacterium]|nr:glycosyltransferase family 4 protein [Myxococcota bacterium]